eukprot:TRINITY_DN6490_c0_g1_i1.p1 TRINITY_DN6490_c0_g1~~TRINITY_DN6490_c0_g1_i1.p1  ORF type:complete len:306 (+),score=52.26 TRINITY_DN6490_c0_g1_i1:156-1073(+)
MWLSHIHHEYPAVLITLVIVVMIVLYEALKRTNKSVTPHYNNSHTKFHTITNKFESLEEVTEMLRKVGLESSNLVVGIDYTKSNEFNGRRTNNGCSLHTLHPAGSAGTTLNPYQTAISIIARTLAPFDEDNLIPTYGFGDITTKDRAVFPFFPDGSPCNGLPMLLHRYTEITPHVQLSGPTSFAPIIREAMRLTQIDSQYHILVIIADGQVTNEATTVDAIVEASRYPLSIIMVGVGDGPWDTMKRFDDELPQRCFDNFQFVELHSILSQHKEQGHAEVAFALEALQEIPEQYQAIKALGYLGRR